MSTFGKFTLSIELGNAAMQDDNDIADALEAIAIRLRTHQYCQGQDDFTRGIKDENGNHVGEWSLTFDSE
jgi:hypothetical protein